MEVSNIWTKTLLPNPIDYLIIAVYLLLIFIISKQIKIRFIAFKPEYKYFVSGLFIKIFAGITFCLVYIFYYKEAGDTIGYYRSSEALLNLFFKNSFAYFSILSGNLSFQNLSNFDIYTGFPWYYNDYQAFSVVRFINPFLILGFRNYFTATILLSAFSYVGIWKMFQMFCELYPKYNKYFAITVFFIPSVLFWGSGLMKDTFTLSASCWYTYNFYKIFIKKKDIFINIIYIVLNIVIILSLKPYIIVALFPGTLIWGFYNKISRVKNSIVRFLFTPIIIILIFGLGYIASNMFQKELGKYSNIESIIKKAQITQKDLIRAEQYGINYYNIGEFKTTKDIIKKIPNAILAGLYRPFIWEANTLFIYISAIENTIILLFTIYIFLFSGKFLSNSRKIFREPLLIFLFLYALFFAFSVGLTTANFGALVRYKIPLLPFFTSGLMILFINNTTQKKTKN